MTSSTARQRILAVGLAATAVAHCAVAPSHLNEVPYSGVLFLGVAAAATVLLLLTATRFETPRAVVFSALLCGGALLGYLYSRTLGLPGLDDDIGNWAEPWGVVAVTGEVVVLVASLLLLAPLKRARL